MEEQREFVEENNRVTSHIEIEQGEQSSAGEALCRQRERGRETPFALLTWDTWQETQMQVQHCLSRFENAVQEKQASSVFMIGLEMQEIATRMLLEAYALSADLPLTDL